ncbi:HalOD1 output domain-containing protein [Natribaculum luteum]|uniref:HalOD1 output domain-containing protein n=1 Tax=Natribaculum luteum TaxID=1586232 RepID=A0ABD5P2P0_9EURY|nr:HalOD1 output domain-containing protein [Natribaculum luteum]
MTPLLETDVELVEQKSNANVYEVAYGRTDRPTLAVVDALARIESVDPSELSPLHDAIDTDALDRLVDHARGRTPEAAFTVTFTFDGYEIEIDHPGRIRIEAPAR